MSPLLDIQRRHATLFRIRLGDTVEGISKKTGKPYRAPRKLTDQIRVTSPNPAIVAAFTDVYGGDVAEWKDRGEYQAYLPTTSLNVWLLPGQGIEQWWERYAKTVCERRCDGVREQKSGKPCMCPKDIDQRVTERDDRGNPVNCQPMTRINVLCPDVAVAGSGALITHGLIAAETLPQAIAVAEGALAMGHWVPAVLRVVEHRGRNHFIVPQIEISGVTPVALLNGHADLPTALQAPARQALPPAPETPAYELPPAPQTVSQTRSVADQMADVEQAPVPSGRKNAAERIKPTGVKPRTMAERSAATDEPPDEVEPDPMPGPQKLAMLCREHGIDRAQVAAAVSDGRTESTRELEPEELARAFSAVDMLRSGEWVLRAEAGKWKLAASGQSPIRAAQEQIAAMKDETRGPAATGHVFTSGPKSGKLVSDASTPVLKAYLENNDFADVDRDAALAELDRRQT